MIIDRNIENYIIHVDTPVKRALEHLSAVKGRILFGVDHQSHLQGVLTNGDLVRWLIDCEAKADLFTPIGKILNTSYKFHLTGESVNKIHQLLHDFLFIPIVDNHHHLIAVARRRTDKDQTLVIDKKIISENDPVYVIAEIGNNHNGSFERAKRLIKAAKQAGADCVKFQMRNMENLYKNSGAVGDAKENLGSQYTLDLLNRFQLSNDDMFRAFDQCKKLSITPLCTPWDEKSVALLEEYGMLAYKVASADLTNHELLNILILTGKPLIISTGMSRENEIVQVVDLLRQNGARYAMLHCNSTYPPPFKDIHLNYLKRLKEISNSLVGYSGHERDIFVPIAAVAQGARIIEKHFTEDRSLEGNDHKVSLLPEEFARMVEGIRQVTEALSRSGTKTMTQGEIINRVTLAKSIFVNQKIAEGEVIESSMLEIKSPGHGLQPNRKMELVGSKAKRAMKEGDVFYESDLENQIVAQPRNYRFKRPWGLPVRYHDYRTFMSKTNLNLLEFHLSYKDLELNIKDYFNEILDVDLVVHSPELFAGDHTLDLCSPDNAYRKHSINKLQRVILVTRELTRYFNKTTSVGIITNVGGFTISAPLSDREKQQRLDLLLDSLNRIDTEGIEIWPQTMPPYPWHFGGQRFHNLFIEAEEIVNFCKNFNYRICLDISHSKLAMNHRGQSFMQFLEYVGPYVAHLHIADAKGLDGEGLQIGDGDIDFGSCAMVLEKLAPQASMIPEIWQGHENKGECFWKALDLMELYF